MSSAAEDLLEFVAGEMSGSEDQGRRPTISDTQISRSNDGNSTNVIEENSSSTGNRVLGMDIAWVDREPHNNEIPPNGLLHGIICTIRFDVASRVRIVSVPGDVF